MATAPVAHRRHADPDRARTRCGRARARLERVFDSGDGEFLRDFRKSAAEHLEVIAGDISEPNLGLDAATW